MRAVRESVAEAPCKRIFYLGHAGAADRRVGGDLGMRGAADALGNPELKRQRPTKGPRFDTVDPPERRWLALDALDKASDRCFAAANTNENTVGIIEDFTRKAEITRDPPNRRPKSHPLHPAAHSNFQRDLLRLTGDALMYIHGGESGIAEARSSIQE